MIYTEADYKRALKQVTDSEAFWADQRKQMAAKGLTTDEIENLQSPSISIMEDLKNDIDWYEQAKKGKFLPITDLELLGKALIALRISRGMTQEEFAAKLKVSQKQISRDELNEYHGISLHRAAEILRVFDTTLETKLVSHGRKAA